MTRGTSAQRIANLPPARWTEQVRQLFPIMLPPSSTAEGSDFNSILLLAHHPQLAEPWLRFNAVVAGDTLLSRRLKELIILRVAWRKGSPYEWTHHVLSGARAGLTGSDFEALQRDETEYWRDLDAAVVIATDDICDEGGIGLATLMGIGQQFNTEQIIEITFVAGCYIALAAILNSAGAAVEAPVMDQVIAAGFPLLRPR